MISFLQLHETPLSHNILTGSFSGNPQSCFILGGKRIKTELEGQRAAKISLEDLETFLMILCILPVIYAAKDVL